MFDRALNTSIKLTLTNLPKNKGQSPTHTEQVRKALI